MANLLTYFLLVLAVPLVGERSMSRLIELPDAIVAELNANDWALDFTADRLYQTSFTKAEMDTLHVTVMVASNMENQITRKHKRRDTVLSIIFRQNVDVTDQAAIDALVNLVGDIHTFYVMNEDGEKRKVVGTNAWVEAVERLQPFSPEVLNTKQQFMASLSLLLSEIADADISDPIGYVLDGVVGEEFVFPYTDDAALTDSLRLNLGAEAEILEIADTYIRARLTTATDTENDENQPLLVRVATSSSTSTPVSAGKVKKTKGRWLANEGTGTTLNDTSGTGNHLTLTIGNGGLWIDDTPGNNAGSGGCIQAAPLMRYSVASPASLPTANGARSIGFWYKLGVSGAVQVQINSASVTRSRTTARIFADPATSVILNAPAVASANAWAYFTFTYSAKNWKFYENGVLVSKGKLAANLATAAAAAYVEISAGEDVGGNARVKDVRVYTSALSAAEVAALAVPGDVTYATAGHWRLNEGTGTTAGDISGNGNSLSISLTGTDTGWDADSPGSQAGAGGSIKSSATGFPTIAGATSGGLPTSTPITCAFWFKPGSSSAGIRLDYGAAAPGFIEFSRFASNDDVFVIAPAFQSPTILNAASVGPSSGWHHYALTVDGSTWKYYQDGALNASGLATASMTATPISMLFDDAMKLKDVRIYSRALTATEVAKLYTG